MVVTFRSSCCSCDSAIELQAYDVVPKSRWRKTVWYCPVCGVYNRDDLQGKLVWVVPAHTVDEHVVH